MLLLITDTSGNHGSVGLVRAECDDVKVVDSVALLEKLGFRKHEIDAFVVISGPGSFTGLRVGLAAIKALAEILMKPIVPVSLLEVIARATQTHGNILAALDAGRSEVYAGEYEPTTKYCIAFGERLLPMNEFIVRARQTVVATPDADLVEALRSSGAAVISVDYPGAEMIARVGWQRLQAGQAVTPEQLEANYIRRSDAEIFAKK
jgi:tRNA threonylcarbamoyladenosine biosynthesis protein TsaB